MSGDEEQPGLVAWNAPEGSQTLPMGYASRQFVTDPAADLAVLARPIVLAVRGEISEMGQIVGVMQVLHQHQRCLLLVAGLVTGQALAVLEINKTRGIYQSAAVNCGIGADGDDLLRAVAALAGGQIVSDASELRSQQPIRPGEAEMATISATSTILQPTAAAAAAAPTQPDARPARQGGLFGRRPRKG